MIKGSQGEILSKLRIYRCFRKLSTTTRSSTIRIHTHKARFCPNFEYIDVFENFRLLLVPPQFAYKWGLERYYIHFFSNILYTSSWKKGGRGTQPNIWYISCWEREEGNTREKLANEDFLDWNGAFVLFLVGGGRGYTAIQTLRKVENEQVFGLERHLCLFRCFQNTRLLLVFPQDL